MVGLPKISKFQLETNSMKENIIKNVSIKIQCYQKMVCVSTLSIRKISLETLQLMARNCVFFDTRTKYLCCYHVIEVVSYSL